MTPADVADELYGIPPEDFVEAREARRKEVRAAGDRELAGVIGKLRKPTTAAWVVNTLVRRQPAEVAELVELGAGLREAQGDLDGDELRELSQQRHRVVAALTRQARSLAQDLGHPVSDSVAGQVQDTLRAAIADETAGQAVLTGRLLTPLSHHGLARIGVEGAVADVGAGGGLRPAAVGTRAALPGRRRGRQDALEKARRELEEAEAAAAEAEEEARADQRRAEEAGARRERARARVDELAEQLREAEREAAEAGEELRGAQRRRDAGERRARRAGEVRDRARARVDRLTAEAGEDARGDRTA
ncbi:MULTISPECIES: hypothetical protein [unclassified Blastococcus]